MKWNLTSSEATKRTYTQEKTGTQCETNLIYTDAAGLNWWGFKDLFKIPYLRIAFSKQVSDFFSTGVTPQDLDKWDEQELQLLRSNDVEKYEKLYKIVLERRQARQSLVDPITLHLSLASVYVLNEDERIDYFDMAQLEAKLAHWKTDTEAVTFFLSWHLNHIQSYTSSLSNISQTVLKPKN